jgi:hypothetical protein
MRLRRWMAQVSQHLTLTTTEAGALLRRSPPHSDRRLGLSPLHVPAARTAPPCARAPCERTDKATSQ